MSRSTQYKARTVVFESTDFCRLDDNEQVIETKQHTIEGYDPSMVEDVSAEAVLDFIYSH